MKRIICGAALIVVSAMATLPMQAMAQVGVNVVIGAAPPPLRYERAPPPRYGYVWAPGYWGWDGRRHIWLAGHWERVRPGYAYDRPEWRQGERGWELRRGGWRHEERREEWRDERRDDHHDERRDDRRDGRDGRDYHCPPGQAKKGNC